MVAQARQSAALRELEQQQEERAALAQELQVPVGEASQLLLLALMKNLPELLSDLCFHLVLRTAKELHWERPLQIIKYPDPRLRAVNARIGIFDDRVRQLGQEMLEVMYNGCAGTSHSRISGHVWSPVMPAACTPVKCCLPCMHQPGLADGT